MNRTRIEWAELSWNPLRGCSRISEGCRNCYAERIAARFASQPGGPFRGFARMTDSGPRWTGRVDLIPGKLDEPLRIKQPAIIFACSMADAFHPAVPIGWTLRIWEIMRQAGQHIFLVLTKRPEIMRARLDAMYGKWNVEVPNNVWVGVSVENQKAEWRIPILLDVPAAGRFVSLEPLLGPVNLSIKGWLRGLGWVIVGGETGPGARPMHPKWAHAIQAECLLAGVPYFFKQWGEWLPKGQISTLGMAPDAKMARGNWGVLSIDGQYFHRGEGRLAGDGTVQDIDDAIVYRVGRKIAGRKIGWQEWDQVPAWR